MKPLNIALFGGAAFLAYKFGLLSSLGIGTPSAPATPAGAAPPPPNPNAITGANTLDGVYARMVAAAWNAYLTGVMPAGFVAPDPMPIFQAAVPGFDRSTNLLTAGQYWAVMAPWLKTNAGLSGLGRRGLGCMYDVMVRG